MLYLFPLCFISQRSLSGTARLQRLPAPPEAPPLFWGDETGAPGVGTARGGLVAAGPGLGTAAMLGGCSSGDVVISFISSAAAGAGG